MTKADKLILQIIDEQQISDQQQLLKFLLAAGINITQSTLSRRLKNLSIIKVNGIYTEASNRKHSIKHLINVTISPPNILVVTTSPSYASSIAAQIDLLGASSGNNSSISGILGTVAGDDTIIVISDGKTDLQKLKSQIIFHLE